MVDVFGREEFLLGEVFDGTLFVGRCYLLKLDVETLTPFPQCLQGVQSTLRLVLRDVGLAYFLKVGEYSFHRAYCNRLLDEETLQRVRHDDKPFNLPLVGR